MISFPDLIELLNKLSNEVAQCPANVSPILFAQTLIAGKREIIIDGMAALEKPKPETDESPASSSRPAPIAIGTPLFARAEEVLREVNNRLGASQLARLLKEKRNAKGTLASIRAALIADMKQASAFGVNAGQETRVAKINGLEVELTAYYFSIV